MTLVNQGLITSDGGRGLTISGPSFTNSGTLQASGLFTIGSSSFTNTGTVEAFPGGHFNVDPVYTQTAGVTRLLGGFLACNFIQFDGGTLEGWGGVYGRVFASGIIDPKVGSTDGLQFNGDLNLGTNAELRFSLGGTMQGTEYDFLSEGGTVSLKLDGTLTVEFANGFEKTVTSANTFTILTSNQNLTGAFDNVASGTRLTTADGLGSFLVTYSGQSVVLSGFIPEPGVAAFSAAAGMLLLSRRRKADRIT